MRMHNMIDNFLRLVLVFGVSLQRKTLNTTEMIIDKTAIAIGIFYSL